MPQCYNCKIAQIFDEFTPAQKNTKMTTFLPLPNLPHFLYLQNNASTNCVTNPKTDWLTEHIYLQKDEQTDKNCYYLDLQDRLTQILTKRRTNRQKPLLSWPTGQTDRQEICFFLSYVAFFSYDSSQTEQTYRQLHAIYCLSILILVTIYHAIRF